jgi:alkanesulfonate monooxygenase SsuD/methylene tetrahydromethanopterin reductase-like flavin-dependent oxidoreductase (luciferase family)
VVDVRYGICIATIGGYAEPGRVVEAALAAEAAGWEGLFVWDHVAYAWGVPSADPWVVLAAVAQATGRLRIGTAVTPLPRRRPVVVAGAVTTLDRLSGGRMIFGAGLGGVPEEFSAFGEPAAAGVRAAMLDEGLEVVAGLWSGRQVTHAGRFYRVDGVTMAPLPVQRPRVPVWIGGASAGARRRAARWDGWVIGCDNEQGAMVVPPDSIAAEAAAVAELRPDGTPFDIAVSGVSAGPGDHVCDAYAEAGATWWLEHIHERRGPQASMLERINAGPPGRTPA